MYIKGDNGDLALFLVDIEFGFIHQVCQWLLAQGMECYITIFMDHTITGDALLSMDSNCLKELGVKNKDDREKIKKKIKELRTFNEKEKKAIKKAEKQAGKKK